jgi:hypothetical protein
LIESVRRHSDLDSPVLMRSLIAEVQRFSAAKQHDDLTVVAPPAAGKLAAAGTIPSRPPGRVGVTLRAV